MDTSHEDQGKGIISFKFRSNSSKFLQIQILQFSTILLFPYVTPFAFGILANVIYFRFQTMQSCDRLHIWYSFFAQYTAQ